MVSRWDYHPPNPGFTHTVVPFFERNLLVVSDEATRNDGADWPKLVWIVDNRTEENPVPIATCPLPPVEVFSRRGGRFGAHNLWENLPKEGCWKSENIVLGTFFNGGLRAFDLSNPYQPKEVGVFRAAGRERADRRLPDQRRVRRRSRHRVLRRPPRRRALRARNGFLIPPPPCPAWNAGWGLRISRRFRPNAAGLQQVAAAGRLGAQIAFVVAVRREDVRHPLGDADAVAFERGDLVRVVGQAAARSRSRAAAASRRPADRPAHRRRSRAARWRRPYRTRHPAADRRAAC